MSSIATRAPARMRPSVMAWPMPIGLPAPVTMAAFPCSTLSAIVLPPEGRPVGDCTLSPSYTLSVRLLDQQLKQLPWHDGRGLSESLVEQYGTRRERRQGIGLNHHHPPAAALHEGINARVSTQAKPLGHAFDARTHLPHHPRRENVRRRRCEVDARAPLKFFFDGEHHALGYSNARRQGFEVTLAFEYAYRHLNPAAPFMDPQLLAHHTHFVRFNEKLKEQAWRLKKRHLHLLALALERLGGNARDAQA